MKNKYIVSLKNVILCFVFVIAGTNWVLAQAQPTKPVISGKVTDKYGNPIAGAEIKLENSDKSTITGVNGDFEFNLIDPNAILEFSYTGYASQKMTIGNSKSLEISLEREVSNKDLIISTVYDERPNYSVTAAVITISGEELNKTPAINLAQALAGRLPGLYAYPSTNEPGNENMMTLIRGTGTPNGKSSLVLIDGVVSEDLQTINPRDVESVTIFKDAASTVLYGMQGGSGIISVITRHGYYGGKPRITVTVDQSVQQAIHTPDMLHSWEYASLRNEAYKNDGYGDYYHFSQNAIDKYEDGSNRELYPDNNWYNYFMKPSVLFQRYNLSASGGSDALKYYTTVAYTHVGGPFEVEQMEFNPSQAIDRLNIRTNVDVKINEYFRPFMNISGLVQRQNGSTAGNNSILSSVFNLPPALYGPLTPDGKVVATPQETDPTYGMINSRGYRKQTSTKMNAIIGLDIDLKFITPGLSTQGSAMFNAYAISNINANTNYERWIRDDITFPDSLAFIKQGTQLKIPLQLTKSIQYSYMSSFSWLLKYAGKWDDHSLNALGFVRYQYENHADLDLNGSLPYKRLTFGARLNYGFKNILFAEAAATYEGSEQFAPGHNYGFFPAVSLAWVLSNQDFLKGNQTITNLKLRASYGVVGNDELFGVRYLYLDNIRQSGTNFISNLSTPINEIQQGNPLLTWEKSRKANFGVELGLLNQLTLNLDLFSENRVDILVNPGTIPARWGLPSQSLPPLNTGRVLNQGFELQLGYAKSLNKDFSLSVQAYMGYNKNIIKEFDEVNLGTDYAYPFRSQGYSIGQNWGYLIDRSNGNGYFNSQLEITNSGLTYEGRSPRPGDFIYKDLNGDKMIDKKDFAPIGNPVYPRLMYGANINMKWKQFDASLLFQGIGQVSGYYSGMGFFDDTNGGTYFDMHRNAWTPERYASGIEITAPALSTTTSSSNCLNDFYVMDKQYVRLKNMEIGYMLPSNLSRKIKTESIRVYLSGQNLLTSDKLNIKDIDVEMGSMTTFPTYRTYNIGISITF